MIVTFSTSSCQGYFFGGEFSNCGDQISFWEFLKRLNLKIIVKILENFAKLSKS
jgi:hypothetical protein